MDDLAARRVMLDRQSSQGAKPVGCGGKLSQYFGKLFRFVSVTI
jgi:hypothetical protein